VLRRIFGPMRDGVTEKWRKLYSEELNDLYLTKYCSGDQIEKKEMGGACKGEER
jgi:hypothetical protein